MRPRLLFNRKKEAAMKRIVPIAKGCLALLLAVSLALAAQAKRNRLLALEAYEQAKTVARLEEERPGLEVAFVPHWKTCSDAGRFRRKKGRRT